MGFFSSGQSNGLDQNRTVYSLPLINGGVGHHYLHKTVSNYKVELSLPFNIISNFFDSF
jgi:hypothetical protein